MISLEHAEGLWTLSLTISEQTLGTLVFACLLINVLAGFFWIAHHTFRAPHAAHLHTRRELEDRAGRHSLRRYHPQPYPIRPRRQAVGEFRPTKAATRQPEPTLLWPRATWQRFTEEGMRANDERVRRAIQRLEREAAGRSLAAAM